VGDWGMRTIGDISFFWVGGAFSVDRDARIADELRTGRKSWWENEELNQRQREMCLAEYFDTKPDIVISHSVPKALVDQIGNPSVLRYFGFDPDTFNTRTQELLQFMFEDHQPNLHIHGHLHISHKTKIGNTRFIGLNELETYIIE
jgi:Icc-related predicted phosphoesterase